MSEPKTPIEPSLRQILENNAQQKLPKTSEVLEAITVIVTAIVALALFAEQISRLEDEDDDSSGWIN
jgi:hypothetical protein